MYGSKNTLSMCAVSKFFQSKLLLKIIGIPKPPISKDFFVVFLISNFKTRSPLLFCQYRWTCNGISPRAADIFAAASDFLSTNVFTSTLLVEDEYFFHSEVPTCLMLMFKSPK